MRDHSENMMGTLHVHVPSSLKENFIDWQTKLNSTIAGFPGFVSLEILSPKATSQQAWLIVQRFSTPKLISNWQQSEEYQRLLKELKELLNEDPSAFIKEGNSEIADLQGGVTEVFVTQVAPDKERAYREWMAKIHQVEAKFPGFRGVYVQAPAEGNHWITLLQFDHPTHLDHWLSFPERAEILKESSPLISNLESHRVISSYAGWFTSLAKQGKLPAAWQQTMLVLLVLFPIVMLEMKYLSPLTASLNFSFATFIGNAISVFLIAWPMMPLAINSLNWWLIPKEKNAKQITLLGTFFVIFLYLLEIAIFWNFL